MSPVIAFGRLQVASGSDPHLRTDVGSKNRYHIGHQKITDVFVYACESGVGLCELGSGRQVFDRSIVAAPTGKNCQLSAFFACTSVWLPVQIAPARKVPCW